MATSLTIAMSDDVPGSPGAEVNVYTAEFRHVGRGRIVRGAPLRFELGQSGPHIIEMKPVGGALSHKLVTIENGRENHETVEPIPPVRSVPVRPELLSAESAFARALRDLSLSYFVVPASPGATRSFSFEAEATGGRGLGPRLQIPDSGRRAPRSRADGPWLRLILTRGARRFLIGDRDRTFGPQVLSRISSDSQAATFSARVFDADPTVHGCIRIEMGGDRLGRRWFSLPVFAHESHVSSWDADGLFRADIVIHRTGPQTARLSMPVSIRPRSERAASILDFLGDTATDDALDLWTTARMDDEAEDALRGKRRDPLAATAAALFLASRGGADRTHDWVRNLAVWFDGLPDGAVLWAYQLLTDPDVSSRAGNWQGTRPGRSRRREPYRSTRVAAWDWALEAERRGPPIYAKTETLQDEVIDRLLREDIAESGLAPKERAEFRDRVRRRRKRRQAVWRCGVVSGGFGTISDSGRGRPGGEEDPVPAGAFQIGA